MSSEGDVTRWILDMQAGDRLAFQPLSGNSFSTPADI
jgi:hypothetical protein